MEFSNYLLSETNHFTKANGSTFECKVNETFDFIPVNLNLTPDPWEEFLETYIEKVNEIENGVFQYDFIIENKNIEEDAPEKYQRFSLKLKIGDKLEIMRFYQAADEDFYYISLLTEITETTKKKFSYKIIGILEDDAEEEDYTYIPMEYKIGDNLKIIPHEAVFSMDVTLKDIKKHTNGFIMTLFIKADDNEKDENQTMTFNVQKGTHLEFDEFETSFFCFIKPDRNPIDVEVLEVSEEGIILKKIS